MDLEREAAPCSFARMTDQLTSWHDTPTPAAIVDLMERVTYADGKDRPGLRLLVLHDDAERELDYTAGAEKSLQTAAAQGWTVASIKDDWTTVFA